MRGPGCQDNRLCFLNEDKESTKDDEHLQWKKSGSEAPEKKKKRCRPRRLNKKKTNPRPASLFYLEPALHSLPIHEVCERHHYRGT